MKARSGYTQETSPTNSFFNDLQHGIAVATHKLGIMKNGERPCSTHWKERLHSLPADRAELVPQSPGV